MSVFDNDIQLRDSFLRDIAPLEDRSELYLLLAIHDLRQSGQKEFTDAKLVEEVRKHMSAVEGLLFDNTALYDHIAASREAGHVTSREFREFPADMDMRDVVIRNGGGTGNHTEMTMNGRIILERIFERNGMKLSGRTGEEQETGYER